MTQYRSQRTLLEAMEKAGPVDPMLRDLEHYCRKNHADPEEIVLSLPAREYQRWTADQRFADYLVKRRQPRTASGREWFGEDEKKTKDSAVGLMSERFIAAYAKDKWRLYHITDPNDRVVREIIVERGGDVREVTREIAGTLEAEGCIATPDKVRRIVDYFLDHGPASPAPVLCALPHEDAWAFHKIRVQPAAGAAEALAGLGVEERAAFMREAAPTTAEFLFRMIDPEAFAAFLYGVYSQRYRGRQVVWLKGAGLDGKSVFMRAFAETVFGVTARAIEWSTIKSQPAYVTSLAEEKKLVWVADCNNPKILLSELFKSMSGDDPVTINRKFEKQYTTRLEAKLLVSSNFSPFILGETHALSRVLPIKMLPRDRSKPDNPRFQEEVTAELPVLLAFGEWAYGQRCRDDFEIAPNEAVLEWIESRVLDANEEFDAILADIVVLDYEPNTRTVRADSAFETPREALYRALTRQGGLKDTHKVHEIKEYLLAQGVREHTRRKVYIGVRLRTDDDDKRNAADRQRTALEAVRAVRAKALGAAPAPANADGREEDEAA